MTYRVGGILAYVNKIVASMIALVVVERRVIMRMIYCISLELWALNSTLSAFTIIP